MEPVIHEETDVNIELQARPFSLTPALTECVQHSLERLTHRHGRRISSISVHMDDVNGKRGGIDKRCRVVVRLAPRLTVVGEALAADLYQAISLAALRAESALIRRDKDSRFRRQPRTRWTETDQARSSQSATAA